MNLRLTSPVVIATHNQGKLEEISDLLRPLGLECISAGSLGLPEPEENGATFDANALIKAKAAAMTSGHLALADDSGLAVDALDGAPGIYSARWAGASKDFAQAMKKIKEFIEKKGIVAEGAPASFICALALCAPNGDHRCFTGTIRGHITFPSRGNKGFGYDPIFTPEGYDITFAQMEPVLKHAISHRAQAFEKLLTYVREVTA